MTPEEVVRDDCIVCLAPAYDVIERLINVEHPQNGGTRENTYK